MSFLWLRTLAIFLCIAASHAGSKKVSVKEVVFDSAVADIKWLGPEAKIVLLQTQKGRLYRSSNGGDTWTDMTDDLKVDMPGMTATSININQIVTSPADPMTVLVVGSRLHHFLSTTGGATWTRLRLKATIHTFVFHKTRPKWAMLSTWSAQCDRTDKKLGDGDGDRGPCNHMLYVTKDMGKTFQMVASYVVQFSWGEVVHKQEDRIYFTHFRKKDGDQPKLTLWSQLVDFSYTDDAGSRTTRLIYKGNKFLISNSYIFVAKLKDAGTQTVSLMVSSDGGRTFEAAKLPQELEEKSYTVLDTAEGTVMLHVNHGTKEPYGVGNVYVSDKDGTRYSLSLPNNVRSTTGDCEFDRVLSLDGVYIANFKDIQRAGDSNDALDQDDEEESMVTQVDSKRDTKKKGKDESVVRTVISFDKGGVWSYLKPPRVDSVGKQIECPPDRCWLHLHGVTNFHNYAPFYSLESAAGIIMGTGNVGPYLRFEPDQINTYLSRDGGLTWAEAHKGAFIYEFGDHGGLLVMADDIRKTKQVVFSWNEGQSWYDFELSNLALEVDNIVTEPNATSTKFLLYGTRGDSGVVYHLDFEALGQPLCKGVWAADSVSSDYETWTPTDGRASERCMLGRQMTYTRRKQTSECFNGEKFERPVTRKNCQCTEEDYDCELGFSRKIGSTECRFTDESVMTVPDKCTTSGFYYVDAYRKVVGDSCEGGWQPTKVGVPCPANSKFSRGAISVLGTFVMIAVAMGSVTFLSKSERFKGLIANYGMGAFVDVKYSQIGAKTPETALDSVGVRHGDFDESAEDDYDEPPQLMNYGDRDRDRDERVERRIETAADRVPRLQGPPRGGAEPEEQADLL
mmetsp:Transcript_55401/g.129702  ORF Transcript_55401/g.129702 Transcript_55401/m.129702 type:complete len:849 (-) Transcript_55401:182-2728(-)